MTEKKIQIHKNMLSVESSCYDLQAGVKLTIIISNTDNCILNKKLLVMWVGKDLSFGRSYILLIQNCMSAFHQFTLSPFLQSFNFSTEKESLTMGKTLTRFIRSSCKLEHTKGTQIDAKKYRNIINCCQSNRAKKTLIQLSS